VKHVLVGLAVILGVGLPIFFFVVPDQVGRSRNGVVHHGPPRASAAARALHERLLVCDLHCDALLWGRDLDRRGDWGHVDVPRLIEGNVALQGFSVVTHVPRGLNIERNDARSDVIFWLALAQRWPPAALHSRTERALYQARRLRDTVERSQGRLALALSRADLEACLARRRAGEHTVCGFLSLEGAQALEDEPGAFDALVGAGFRMIGLAHFFDNAFAGSAHGTEKGGLSERGRALVREIEARKLVVDLAHVSPRAFDDVLAMARRPVVVSHTGVKATCDNPRNLSDAQLRAVAQGGGVVGIGVWETAVCGSDAAAVARAVGHAIAVAGAEHVAIGTDFDGSVQAPFDATGLVEITDALLAQGLSEAEVAGVMGGNAARTLAALLP
jgi:microsomal dipeptidase-like Zn-dependent dipeptidase